MRGWVDEATRLQQQTPTPALSERTVVDPDWWRRLPADQQGDALVGAIHHRVYMERRYNTLVYGTPTPSLELLTADIWRHYAARTGRAVTDRWLLSSRGYGKNYALKQAILRAEARITEPLPATWRPYSQVLEALVRGQGI